MRGLRSPWLWGAAALALAAVFVFDLTPWVRGGFGWRWEYSPLARSILGYAVVLALYVVLASRLLAAGARPRTVLALAFAAAVVLPVVAAGLRDGDALYTLFARTFSLVASAHHQGAAQIDWAGGEWRDWTAVMARLGSHLATSPPGQPMLYGLVADGIDRLGLAVPLARPLTAALCLDYRLYDLTTAEIASGWLGVLSPLWAALTVFPLYSLARRLGANPAQAALLWPLVPGLSAFAASSSTVFPLIAVVVFLPLAGTLSRRTAAVSGLLFGAATLVNFALLPLAAIAGLYVLFRWLQAEPRPPLSRLAGRGLFFAAGGLVPWAVWFALTGQTPLDLLAQALGVHLALERPYWFWSWFHLWDWAVWSGAAISAAALVAGIRLWRTRSVQPASAAFAFALALTLAILTLSGATRGESGRIWLFLTPFLLVVAASRPHAIRWTALAAAQALLTVALIFAVDAYNTPDVPARPALAAVQAAGAPLATFVSPDGGEFALRAAEYAPPGVLRLDIDGRVPTLLPVWFGVIVQDLDGRTAAALPQQPISGGGRMPSTCWAAGSTSSVTVALPPLDGLAGDQFYISLSAYGFRAGDPSLTVETDGTTGSQIGLGPFRLRP